MRKVIFILLLLGCSTIWALQTPGQIIFKTTAPLDIKGSKTGLSAFDSFLSAKGLKGIKAITGMPKGQYYLADLEIMPENQVLADAIFPGIAYLQPNYLRKLHLYPNDTLYNQQLHYVSQVEEAWNYSTGNKLIKVGVIDSGVLINHPDLQANIWINPLEIPNDGIDNDSNGYIDDVNGWDFADAPEMAETALGDYYDQDNDVEDENFHGTHVSGIIGAVGNNGIGVAGVCWNVTIMPLRAGFRTTGGQGYLQDDDAAAAIIYAADNGCKVINMSWGDTNYAPIIADACEYAYAKGVVLVASAGNEAGADLSYPAKLSCVISVGSVTKGKALSGFSSYGPDLDLVAVGERVLSTYKLEAGEQYFLQDGTSMSSPYVSGSAALLLSLHPDLSPQEVRSWLCNSAEDLAPQGYDDKTGHGLVNAKNLLETANPPYVVITSPPDQLGISGTVPILGSVYGADFFRYSVCFANLSDPDVVGWFDVTNHTSQPTFHTQPVHDGLLAEFYIPSSFPEGTYLIRVQYEKNQNNTMKYNYYRMVILDRSAPTLVSNSLENFSRYDGPNLRYYVSAGFNENVRGELRITDSQGNEHQAYSVAIDSLQIWALPPTLPEGPVSISFSVRNSAGLSYVSQAYPNFLNVTYGVVSNHGFEMQEIGNPRRPLHQHFDFDDNGTPDYIAMDLPNSGYGTVKVYEPHANGHVQKFSYDDAFWPLDIGNTNNIGGKELLLIRGDTAYLWETPLNGVYPDPDLAIWTDTSITGGVLNDYDDDGLCEVLVVKNLASERVIQSYKRNSSGVLTARNTLSNPTSTFVRNNFVPTLIVDNLDNDAHQDILCADTDGDVLVYEILNASTHELCWNTRLPVGNTYSLASGDFDGDGTNDFIVGGYNTSITNPNLNFWYFQGFTRADDNSYTSMGSIMFNEIASQNSITTADFDRDGKDEIVLALAPNLYVMKYQNGSFVPTFHGESIRNYQVSTWEDTDGVTRIIANIAAGADSSRAVQWTPQEPFTGPATPANLIASPRDENSVYVTWIGTGAPAYRLYMKDENDVISYLDLSATSYIHSGLDLGKEYRYAVAALDPAFSPQESVLSVWKTAIPMPQPYVESIGMVTSHEVRVIFSQAMPPDFVNANLYFLSNGAGNPITANSLNNHRGILLRFRNPLPEIDSLFTLQLHNLTGATGVPLSQDIATFPYVTDTLAPQIESVSVLPSHQEISIKFSEELSPTPAQYLPNFVLTTHQNDPDNHLVSASLTTDTITLGFAEKLKISNQAYFIRIDNLTDLAGNLISPQFNIARFSLSDIRNLDDLTVFPNPVTSKHYPEARFIHFPPHKKGDIAIYNSSGDLVFQSAIGPFDPYINNLTFIWNLKNNDGIAVSSGIYFYVVKMGNEMKRGKLGIIR